jgi:cobalamin biosynthesis Mg chelatase CobN
MRSIVVVFVLMFAAASVTQAQQAHVQASTSDIAVQSQQAAVAVPTHARDLRPVDAPIGFTRSNAGAEAIERNRAAEERTAFQDPSARNVLAIIGAVVIVVAVIALLR